MADYNPNADVVPVPLWLLNLLRGFLNPLANAGTPMPFDEESEPENSDLRKEWRDYADARYLYDELHKHIVAGVKDLRAQAEGRDGA